MQIFKGFCVFVAVLCSSITAFAATSNDRPFPAFEQETRLRCNEILQKSKDEGFVLRANIFVYSDNDFIDLQYKLTENGIVASPSGGFATSNPMQGQLDVFLENEQQLGLVLKFFSESRVEFTLRSLYEMGRSKAEFEYLKGLAPHTADKYGVTKFPNSKIFEAVEKCLRHSLGQDYSKNERVRKAIYRLIGTEDFQNHFEKVLRKARTAYQSNTHSEDAKVVAMFFLERSTDLFKIAKWSRMVNPVGEKLVVNFEDESSYLSE